LDELQPNLFIHQLKYIYRFRVAETILAIGCIVFLLLGRKDGTKGKDNVYRGWKKLSFAFLLAKADAIWR
jgi:hypothetical protein